MEQVSQFAGSFWSILPPILAIGLALLTKEVYLSLILGIFAGGLLWTGGNLIHSLEVIFSIMTEIVACKLCI